MISGIERKDVLYAILKMLSFEEQKCIVSKKLEFTSKIRLLIK